MSSADDRLNELNENVAVLHRNVLELAASVRAVRAIVLAHAHFQRDPDLLRHLLGTLELGLDGTEIDPLSELAELLFAAAEDISGQVRAFLEELE